MYVKNKISLNVSLIIACTQRSDVLFSFSFFWKTSACARVSRARAQSEGGAQERKISIFFFPHPYPFALAVNKSPAFFFFIRRARRTLKRKQRVCEQATLIRNHTVIKVGRADLYSTLSPKQNKNKK